jgi:hypothetical protein
MGNKVIFEMLTELNLIEFFPCNYFQSVNIITDFVTILTFEGPDNGTIAFAAALVIYGCYLYWRACNPENPEQDKKRREAEKRRFEEAKARGEPMTWAIITLP